MYQTYTSISWYAL